jgi:hypothetical protein
MNEQLFKNHLKELFSILDDSGIDNKEISQRKTMLTRSVEEIRTTETEKSYSLYHQRAHEIESLLFLTQFGNIKTAENYKNDEGCDFILNSDIFIECVCSSFGDITNNGLGAYLGEGVFDYNKKKAIINTRFTSSIGDKINFYNERIGRSIPCDKPYIIFLGVGRLAYEWMAEKYGMALLDILFGREFPAITIDIKSNEIVKTGYTHNEKIQKSNGAPIDCNIFLRQDYKCVSAIILSVADLGKRYDYGNTHLFLNPNAQNPFPAKLFWGLVYWKESKDGHYSPRRKGRVLR